MPSTLPEASPCCTPCETPVSVEVAGPAGAAGAAGAAGTDGTNAWTTTTADFLMPAEAGSVTASVADSTWMALGQIIFIQGAGYLQVSAKPTTTSVTVINLENTASGLYPNNVGFGTNVTSGKIVSPAGIQGPAGATPAGALLAANDLSDVATPATSRNNLGLGSAAVLDSGVTNGDLAPVDGGLTDTEPLFATATGIESQAPATARTSLGLAIGTDVQAYDAELAALAGLTSAANKLPYFTGAGTAALTDLSAFARTLLDDADAATARATLGVSGGALLLYEQVEIQNTPAGAFNSGSWVTVPLNTESVDPGGHGSIAASIVTLDAGTYEAEWGVIGNQVNQFVGKLYNVDSATDIAYGSSATSASTDGTPALSIGHTRFTLAVQTQVSLRARCLSTKATDGFGIASNFAAEHYSWLRLHKTA